jgi:hypothetical protein
MLSLDHVPQDALHLLHELPLLHAEAVARTEAHSREYEGLKTNVSLADYLRLVMIVKTRTFGFPSGEAIMVPGLDMINFKFPYNVRRFLEPESETRTRRVELRALGNVSRGAELTLQYFLTHTPRNDVLFSRYGFVDDSDRRLFACDAAEHSLTQESRELQGDDLTPAWGAQTEKRRLQAILDSLTPVEEDRRQLSVSSPGAALEVLRLRVARKEALIHRIGALSQHSEL